MALRRTILATAVGAALAWPAAASAQWPDGRHWKQVNESTGLTWNQVAAVCPRDGESRCSGAANGRDLTNWIWATDRQVVELMGHYEPEILTAEPPSVGGVEYLFQAMEFLGAMRPTFSFSGYPTTHASVNGWTASDRDGVPLNAGAGYTFPVYDAGFSVGTVIDGADTPSAWRGVWLWRPGSDDLTKPVVRANVSGTLGNQGWYRSDVTVTWTVEDPESEIVSTSGCEAASVTADTAGTTLTCTATSGGGTTTVSTTVMRDTVPPVITCGTPAPTFTPNQVGGVPVSWTDTLSGPPFGSVNMLANTNTTGSFFVNAAASDRAGNRATATCPYTVGIPLCNGKTPTIVGTGLNNNITGTPGDDVIQALGGNDTIDGRGGNDTICGGDHIDRVLGGDGADWIDGGTHNDDLNGGNGDDYIDGGAGSDSVRGDGGRDTCLSGEQRMSSCEITP
jgi:hypothetical protein